MTRDATAMPAKHRIPLGVGALGSFTCAAVWWLVPERFFVSWLFAWLFVLGIILGSMAIVMVHELTGGVWGFALRRPLEATLQTLPLLALLSLPLAFGLHLLYPWAGGAAAANIDPATAHLLAQKRWFLNPVFVQARAVAYLAIWLALAWTLQRYWSRGETNAGIEPNARLRALSIVGLMLYAVTVTLASVDWIMSLSAEWYSTAFGFLMIISQALGAYVFALAWSASTGEIRRCVADVRAAAQDLGNLLLMFVMLWAYIAFMQFLIIWAADLPREISWYIERSTPAWKMVAIAVLALQFVAPFAAMLFRVFKRDPRRLAMLCVVVLVAHALEMLWLVAPGFRANTAWCDWTDLAALASIGGLCFAFFLTRCAVTRSMHAPAPSPPGVAEHA